MSIDIKKNFDDYLKVFNTHNIDNFCQYYAPDFHLHLPAFPPVNSREEIRQLFQYGLSFFRETIHPTCLVFGERSLAMEAKMDSEALVDIESPFPFTGKTYKKGERFVYAIVCHYEFNDDGLIQTWRCFSEVQYPDPGAGIKQDILPGY